ncbi:MAG TPA: adenylate/guanylate cyclase domain-containing protein [bacterium]|nr:adenylate/guanylate cyclase domain-containing protein [bacterium]
MATRNLAIMFTDIQGFTARTSASTRDEVHDLLRVHEHLLKPAFAAFRGNIVKTIGDAFLVWFESPTDAVLCGLAVQEVLRQRNARVDDAEKLHVRVAINAGDVELRKDAATGMMDIYGEAVNLAARLEGITEADEVWFTEAVYLTMNRAEAPSTEIGERTFKGIPNPVRVYKVVYEPGSEAAKALAARVKIDEKGRPSISRDLPPAVARAVAGPSRMKEIGGLILAIALVLAGLVSIYLRTGAGRERPALVAAKHALAQHHNVAALEVLGPPADRGGSHPAIVDLARIALGDELAARATKNEPREETLAWMRDLEGRHPGLAPVVDPQIPPYDVFAAVTALLAKEQSDEEFWTAVRAKLATYPGNKDVALAAADAIAASKDRIAAFPLWLYKKAYEDGHAPDPKVFDRCVETWGSYVNDEWANEASELAIAFFPRQQLEWAQKAVTTTANPWELENALRILEAAKDPAAATPDARALRDLLEAKDMPAAKKVLASATPAQKERAVKLLATAADHFTFTHSNRLDVVAEANNLAGKKLIEP